MSDQDLTSQIVDELEGQHVTRVGRLLEVWRPVCLVSTGKAAGVGHLHPSFGYLIGMVGLTLRRVRCA